MKKKKIKILHVAQAAGGVDRYIRMLLKYLDKEKFENILVCSQDFREKDYKNLVDFFEQVKMDTLSINQSLLLIRHCCWIQMTGHQFFLLLEQHQRVTMCLDSLLREILTISMLRKNLQSKRR